MLSEVRKGLYAFAWISLLRSTHFDVLFFTVVGVGQDVTEDRRKAEELRKLHCLQATQEAKVETERNMTAYFAHELRNPLNAIDNVSPLSLARTAHFVMRWLMILFLPRR